MSQMQKAAEVMTAHQLALANARKEHAAQLEALVKQNSPHAWAGAASGVGSPLNKCLLHPDQILYMWCMDPCCQKFICTVCAQTKHVSHKKCDAEEAAEERRALLGKRSNQINQDIARVEKLNSELASEDQGLTASGLVALRELEAGRDEVIRGAEARFAKLNQKFQKKMKVGSCTDTTRCSEYELLDSHRLCFGLMFSLLMTPFKKY
jgi:hypothetical protein